MVTNEVLTKLFLDRSRCDHSVVTAASIKIQTKSPFFLESYGPSPSGRHIYLWRWDDPKIGFMGECHVLRKYQAINGLNQSRRSSEVCGK